MNKENILICKNDKEIIISYNCKKFIISNNEPIFKELQEKTKDEIKEWYINR